MARKSAPAPKSARKVAATKSGAKAIDAELVATAGG